MSETQDWIFCSSGARASFLRANVKNLALPPGEVVQFRYRENDISPAFQELLGETAQSFEGHSAYLTYLDNRTKGVDPKIIPLRQASILSCYKRGSTYIIKLKVDKYLNWKSIELEKIKTFISSEAKTPGWIEENKGSGQWNSTGYWIFKALPQIRLNLIEHDPQNKSHLSSLEAAVDACFTGKDFKDAEKNWIFCNFFGPRESDTFLKNKVLQAGKNYSIPLYHYKPGNGSHGGFEPFFLKVTSNNKNIEFTASNKLKVESAYDEKVIHFRVKKNAPNSSVTFNINVYCDRGNYPQVARHNCLDFDITYKIKPSIKSQAWGVLGIAMGLFVAQAAAFYRAEKLDFLTVMFIVLGSLFAGYCAYSASKKS